MEWLRQNEISIPVEIGDQEFLFDPHYDTVHIFSWLGHSIIKLIVEGGGLAQIHCPDSYGYDLAERAEVEPFMRTTIGQREYEAYKRYLTSVVDDSWLER